MKQLSITFLLLFTIFFVRIDAQVNTDSIFSRAIYESKNQRYIQAIEESKKALSTDPNRGDIMVYLANVYSWQTKNDSAMVYIQMARKIDYHQNDFFESWSNILLRSHQYAALLESCNEAEKFHYSSEDILKKRLIANTELKTYANGVSLVELAENQVYKNTEPINSLYSNLLLKRNKHVITAYYTLDLVDSLSSQHLGSVGYSFPVNDNTMAIRANYANRFNKNDLQLESDFYFKLNKGQYMYFNYGYAFGDSLFPSHRLGFEYYFPLKQKAEASIGSRYMKYPNSNVLIFTGHLGKYFDQNWVSFRPFYVYKLESRTQSVSFIGNYRFFETSELNYWGIEIGFGNSPDDIYSTSQTGGLNKLSAYKVKLEKNFMLDRVSDLHIGLGYTREEFGSVLTKFRNRFTVELGYKVRLK